MNAQLYQPRVLRPNCAEKSPTQAEPQGTELGCGDCHQRHKKELCRKAVSIRSHCRQCRWLRCIQSPQLGPLLHSRLRNQPRRFCIKEKKGSLMKISASSFLSFVLCCIYGEGEGRLLTCRLGTARDETRPQCLP